MSCRFILLLGQSNRGGVWLVLGSVSYFKRARRELCDLRPHYRCDLRPPRPHYRSVPIIGPSRSVPLRPPSPLSVPIIAVRPQLSVHRGPSRCDLRPHYRSPLSVPNRLFPEGALRPPSPIIPEGALRPPSPIIPSPLSRHYRSLVLCVGVGFLVEWGGLFERGYLE